MKSCGRCNCENDDQAAVCCQCGAPLPVRPGRSSDEPARVGGVSRLASPPATAWGASQENAQGEPQPAPPADFKSRLEEIFAAALNLAPGQQAAFLDRACGEDAELRRQAESLLRAHEDAGGFLARTVQLPPPESAGEQAGMRIGRYKLLEKIGEGGFGVVWMAEQEEPVRRRVALKVIKLGMDTREVIARFEAERQALAMMDHPNIAHVFDGGATRAGRPYFVMELVRGIPITEYCDANRLSLRERLELFACICQAVQHAHQKGIIHRDLKPSNILVTVQDDRPVPKVIDFGVAKATQARLTEKTLFTRFHQFVGTPAYMSPEQAGLGSFDVDTRSDIYSLGVLLYELLTGRTPFDTQALLREGYEAILRTIREAEPPRPSTRLSTLTLDELRAVAASRGAEPRKLGRLLRGDLDWVVMRALEKDRARRYSTASALAGDIHHFLADEPVEATPPSLARQVGRFLRRHRLVAATTAAILVVLSGATGISLRLALVASRERDKSQRAEHAAETSAAEKHEQLVRINVANGIRALESSDWFGALLWFTEALREDHPGSRAEQMHRYRIGALLGYSPRLSRLWAHDGPVHTACFSPNGRWALTASGDNTARLWDVASGQAGPILRHVTNVTDAVFSRDGRSVLTIGEDGAARVWNSDTGQPIGPFLVHEYSLQQALISPEGQRVYTLGDRRRWRPDQPLRWADLQTADELRIWDSASGRQVRPPLHASLRISQMALSPNGRWLAVAVGTSAVVWDLREYQAFGLPAGRNSQAIILPRVLPAQPPGDPEARLPEIPALGESGVEARAPSVACLAFSPDSQCVLTVFADYSACVWSLAGGPKLHLHPIRHTPSSGKSVPQTAAFSPNGRTILVADGDGLVLRWDARTGVPAARLEKRTERNLCLSPDGRLAFLAGQVWDMEAGQAFSPTPLQWACRNAAFSPDTARVLTAGADGTVRLWDLVGTLPDVPPLKHDPQTVAASRNARDDALPPSLRQQFDELVLRSLPARVRAVFSHDGQRVATVSEDGSARLWEAASGAPLTRFMTMGQPLSVAAFSRDDRKVATGGGYSDSGIARVWDARTGDPLTPIMEEARRVEGVVFSPDGRWLIITTDREARLWDCQAGQPLEPPFKPAATVRSLAFSLDGSLVAACAGGPRRDSRPAGAGPGLAAAGGQGAWETRLYHARNWEPATPALAESNVVVGMEFSPDGRWLLTFSEPPGPSEWWRPLSGTTVRLWDAATGKPASNPRPFSRPFDQAIFSSDSHRLLVVRFAADSYGWELLPVRAMDLAPWRGLKLHPTAVTGDGQRVATAQRSVFRVYDAVTGEPLGPPLPAGAELIAGRISFSPDGACVSVAAGDRAQLFRLPFESRPVADLVRLAELLAGRKLDASGDFVPLSSTNAIQSWHLLQGRFPSVFAASPAQRRLWHERFAEVAEAECDWSAALLHFEELLIDTPNDLNLRLRQAHARNQAALELLK